MTGLAALLGSVCWFCDRAAVARGSALSAESVCVSGGGGSLAGGQEVHEL